MLQHSDTVMIYCSWQRDSVVIAQDVEMLFLYPLTGKAVFVHGTEGLGLVDIHSEMVPVAPWKAE